MSAATSFSAKVVADALPGLLAERKTLPAKLLYDEEGCRLFTSITALPEYYLTRTEHALLETAAPEIREVVPAHCALVEYGASDEGKASVLLNAAEQFVAYVPIDVASGALDQLVDRLARARPALTVLPVVADFLRPIFLPALVLGLRRFGFFPGSTIGNLDPAAAVGFLIAARATLGEAADFLVGVDMRKPASVLLPAYDDAAGVTAAFNLNLLRRLNREAAADFALDSFAHRATWNDVESRVEMHLVSRLEQTVTVAGQGVRFAAGETIHTESSYKHTLPGFAALATEAGWHVERVWTDQGGLFSLHLLRAKAA